MSTRTQNIARHLKARLENHPFIDVGEDAHVLMGATPGELDMALGFLESEGYPIRILNSYQKGTADVIQIKVLTARDKTFANTHEALKQGKISAIV